MELHYDPDRLRDLDRRVVAAAADLAGLASSDPVAAEAMRAVRLARDHLELDWLPLLGRLVRCDAMLSWSSAAPAEVDASFTALGGAGTAELLLELDTRDDAIVVRDRLVEASRRGTLPPDFADDLVAAFVDELDRTDVNAGAALSFLLSGRRLGTAFLVDLTRAIVRHELASAGDDPEWGGSLWAPCSGLGAPPSILVDERDREPGDSYDLRPGGDPMMAVLDALAVDADAGREVFTDERIARYLLGERDYWMDGMRRVADAAAAAAVDSPLVASAFVNHVGSREGMSGRYDIEPVREAAATVLAHHIASVQLAVVVPETGGRPVAAVVPIVDEVRGARILGAYFDADALDVVTTLAAGSVVGTATLRAATDVHQRRQAAAGSERIANGEITDPDRFLREALADAARLEAHLVGHVGRRAEAMGRSRDEAIRFWTDAASGALDTLPVDGLDVMLDPAAEALADGFAGHEAAAARDAEADADAAADRLTYEWYRQLYRHDLVVPDLPAGAVVDGALVPWSQFQELSAPDRQAVRQAMEETTGVVNIDGHALRDVIKTHQLPDLPGAPVNPQSGRDPSLGAICVGFRDDPRPDQKMPAGGRPSSSARPSSHARRVCGGASKAASGKPVIPIGRRAFQRISITPRSSRTYSPGQSSGPYPSPRSARCTSTSRQRANTRLATVTSRPSSSRLNPSHRVWRDHAASSRSIVPTTSATCSCAGLAAPASMSALRVGMPPG